MFLLGLMFAGVASAMDCQNLPSCESLGYSKENVESCAKDGYVLCPWDNDYKKCIDYDCEALGFTESDKTSWCADLIKCEGNEKMTLCQKPCFATDYASLKELTESGKCKVVTMRNDIIIPQNENITLHADTIIDGGNHTITSSGNKENLTIFSMNDKTGMKNLKLRHTQTQTQDGFSLVKALSDTNHVSLENMDIVTSSDDKVDHWTPVFDHGAYNIIGKFVLDIQAVRHLIAFRQGPVNFTDAQVSVKIEGVSGDMFGGSKAGAASFITFTNSSLDADIEGVYFVNASATLKNSTAQLHRGNLFWGLIDQVHNVILDGSSFTSTATRVNDHTTANITLQNASVLNLTFKEADTGGGQTSIITTDTTEDTLILNGTTYHPTKAATTELTEIDGSENWKKVP